MKLLPVRFGIFSDLHFAHNPAPQINMTPDALYVDAGDCDGPLWIEYLKTIATEQRASLVNVLGNHDFYGRQFPRPGENQWSIIHRGIKIAGCTLWTDLSDPDDWDCYVNSLIDSKLIRGLTWGSYQAAHRADCEFLFREKPDVVVTHHSPSMKSCHPKWGSHRMNYGFHQKTNRLIDQLAPKLWIHGHTHDPSDYVHGPTRVICNPKGYPGENLGFAIKYVEV